MKSFLSAMFISIFSICLLPTELHASKTSETKNVLENAKGASETLKRFEFDPRALEWTAYNEAGELVASGPASGGADYCPDVGKRCRTVEGEYTVYSRKGANCRSSIFPVGKGGAPMPYCTFFHKGYAVHGSYQPLDANRSHGCVRVSPEDAKWLYENFLTMGTKVVIKPYAVAEKKEDGEKLSLEEDSVQPGT